MNPIKTDKFNFLQIAGRSAKDLRASKCAEYVTNTSNTFFPVDGGGSDDPIWNNSASNVFKRSVFGLIDYLIEEEKLLIKRLQKNKTPEKIIQGRIDQLWGMLTPYNIYLMLTQMASKNLQNPANKNMMLFNASVMGIEGNANVEDPDSYRVKPEKKLLSLDCVTEEGLTYMDEERYKEVALERAQFFAKLSKILWEDKKELDLMTLFFNTMLPLPVNSIRRLAMDADSSLRSMKGADKMMGSVYAIATVTMGFFADTTIRQLTDATPSQTIDLESFSFPRNFGFQFDLDYIKKYNLVGCIGQFESYSDKNFTEKMKGKDFEHEGMIDQYGWVNYLFKGIYPTDVAYVKLKVINPLNEHLFKVFYFKFELMYLTNLTGRKYLRDPITKQRVPRNGVLIELQNEDGKFIRKKSTYLGKAIKDIYNPSEGLESFDKPVFRQTFVRYHDKPKMLNLITPPHLPKYIRLPLILLGQLLDINFASSYMGKSTQKPLYNTVYIIDEAGNLKSDGQGIPNLSTVLSIALGQGQEFLIVLQTMQQLKDVYGDTQDKNIQGNTSNLVFLKSNDVDSTIKDLVSLTGIRHVAHKDSKSVQRDISDLLTPNEGKLSYTMSAKEEATISMNDFLFLPPQNWIVIQAGDYPIWNRNETIMPMSYMMYGGKNQITDGEREYSIQTLPSLSEVSENSIYIDPMSMVSKRIQMSTLAEKAINIYNKAYNINVDEIYKLNSDVYADGVMDVLGQLYFDKFYINNISYDEHMEDEYEDFEKQNAENLKKNVTENKDYDKEKMLHQKEYDKDEEPIYFNRTMSKRDFRHGTLDGTTAQFIREEEQRFKDSDYFDCRENGIYGIKNGFEDKLLVSIGYIDEDVKQNAIHANKYDNNGIKEELDKVKAIKVNSDWYNYLTTFDSWYDLFSDHKFDELYYKYMDKPE